jgi:hypothetical protein
VAHDWWYGAAVPDRAEGWNDGQLLTPHEAISMLGSLIDPANPPDRYPVAIVLSPGAVARLNTWREGSDMANLATWVIDSIHSHIEPGDDAQSPVMTAKRTLEYVKGQTGQGDLPAIARRPGGKDSRYRVLILGLNAQQIADLEYWQDPPSLVGRPWSDFTDERAPGKNLDPRVPGLALEASIDLDRADQIDNELYVHRWEQRIEYLTVGADELYTLGQRAGLDSPAWYVGVLKIYGARATCGHQHITYNEAVQCARDRLIELATGKRRGRRWWQR